MILLVIVLAHIAIIGTACMFAFGVGVGLVVLVVPSFFAIFLYKHFKHSLDDFSKPSTPFFIKKQAVD